IMPSCARDSIWLAVQVHRSVGSWLDREFSSTRTDRQKSLVQPQAARPTVIDKNRTRRYQAQDQERGDHRPEIHLEILFCDADQIMALSIEAFPVLHFRFRPQQQPR